MSLFTGWFGDIDDLIVVLKVEWTVLLSVLASLHPNRMGRFFKIMSESKVKPDTIAFNILIRHYMYS